MPGPDFANTPGLAMFQSKKKQDNISNLRIITSCWFLVSYLFYSLVDFLSLNILIKPVQISFEAVFLEWRVSDAMVLIRIDNKQGWNTKSFKWLIHHFRIQNWAVKVLFSTNKQCRCGNISDIVNWRKLFP